MVANPTPEMTLDEWAAMDEDEEGELVDGILVEEEMPSWAHELIVSWLIHALHAWLGDTGVVFGSEGKFAVASRRGRKPDLSVYLAGRRPRSRGAETVPPDILVEVVSPQARDQRRDRVEKLAEYAAFGVRWYWLVDPGLRTVEILELGTDGRYAHATSATDTALDPVPGCAGLALDVPALWERVDWLESDDA